jgi:hypothetical protein
MGEIARRQFLNKILFLGRSALQSGAPRAIMPYLSVRRSGMFNPEIGTLMTRGAEAQLHEAWESMPPISSIGREDFLDLLIVRYRFPNYAGFEQTRMDEEVVSYMPYAQPSFLRLAFHLDLAEKRRGRLFRRVIRESAPDLTHFPLVKGTTPYPYIFTGIPAWGWVRAKKALGMSPIDTTPARFLTHMREFVSDLARSTTVKGYAPYDQVKIVQTVDGFYAGRLECAWELDWWLGFELWRRKLDPP